MPTEYVSVGRQGDLASFLTRIDERTQKSLSSWLARSLRLAIHNVPHINGPQDIKAHVGEINIAPFEGKQFATTKSRRHSQQPHQATNWNFGRNIDTSQRVHRGRVFSIFLRPFKSISLESVSWS